MKRIFSLLLFTLLIYSCTKDTSNVTVKGSIDGLKKGTLYLQKIQDTLLVKLDSISINGNNSNFELHTNIEEPEVLYLVLDDNSKEQESISFFANKGITEINTSLKRFVNATIKGSTQQQKLEEFYNVITRYNNQNLELIKKRFEAERDGDTITLDSINIKSRSILKRKYLYAVNFAINNKNNQVAPYIALSEIYDANIKYLDTIYNVLPDSISGSKYGKALNKFIKERKEFETQNQ
ncbi:DUF4369 domain-containing protein [Flavobacteriaceae bacterium AU392]|nr:DUF4369 domain-containing protein [Flavobacteriaceae bacterium]RKM81140.1 DUF4369 domain-containing protein [Flavobacteriaceae bacterium AU392]